MCTAMINRCETAGASAAFVWEIESTRINQCPYFVKFSAAAADDDVNDDDDNDNNNVKYFWTLAIKLAITITFT